MKVLPTLLAATFIGCFSALAADIPSRWLEGTKGFAKAEELQQETGKPILVWTTWTTCSHCNTVTRKVDEFQFRKHLKDAIKVVLDEKGKKEESELCQSSGFNGGYFYVLPKGQTKPSFKIRAWPVGTYKMEQNLDASLAQAIAAAQPAPES